MSKLSVIIPSYNCKYVSKTVESVFANATGEIEAIVVLDGYKPNPLIKDHKNLTVVYKGFNSGMRSSINLGARIASGDYLMKLDDHCLCSVGFDEALIKDSQENQISIPSRYSLDVVNWKPQREPIEYEYATFPYVRLDQFRYGCGLVAKKWEGENGNDPKHRGVSEYYFREHQRKEIKIDEIMIFHGSCWFMPRKHFFDIDCLDEKLFNTLYCEPQELSYKTWLSGGRVVVNKNAWYAHMHKGPDLGDAPNIRGYRLDVNAMRETERFGTWYWMNDQWPKATKKMKWLIEKFWPIPGWPSEWEQRKVEWEQKYPLKGVENAECHSSVEEHP